MTHRFCVLGIVAGVLSVSGALCARFDFDEGNGAYAEDAVAKRGAALMPGAQWAQGGFGTALATGPKGACAAVEALPGIDGGSTATLFLRFRKEDAGTGRYPCLLTSDEWGARGKGGTLFFSSGAELTVRLRADGTENAWTAFHRMPTGRWCSVALVFSRPDLTVYADGHPVAKGKWDHPFLLGRTCLGAWGADSFGGLIDDFRVWNEALSPERIAAVAAEGRWKENGAVTRRTGLAGKTALRLDGSVSTLAFDTAGCIVSLREKATKRELVAAPQPFATVTLDDGSVMPARRLEKLAEDRFACSFPGRSGRAVFTVKPFPGGWTFKVERFAVAGAKTLAFARVTPVCAKWKGAFANAWSDETSAVAVRACEIVAEPSFRGGALAVWVEAAQAAGVRAALAAGPRAKFRDQLKAMTVAAGVPRSDCGGAWSLGSEQARRSYVFASVTDGDIDYWIDFARRSGFSIIHLNYGSWSGLLGPYPINPKAFPGGIAEMKAAADRVHAAGLQMGIHSLTGCINPRADWIHPVCDTNLVADHVYTLAAPLAPDARELVVNERPGPKHATVFTYSSNGNVLRLGHELLQYSGIRRERPYAFTGLTRGAFGTRKDTRTIPAGTAVDYLHQRYIAFYPDPDSALADRLADRLGEVYNTCGLDDFYFDGSEGMGTRYGIDAMRHKIFSRFRKANGHSPSVEASCEGANNWWFQTRVGTVDHPLWGMKRFHDWHLDWAVEIGRNANFLEPQMGWWAPRTALPGFRGHFPDEMEYFAAKNAGHDAAMSVEGVTARPLPISLRRQLAILGWYERARLARAFTDEAKACLAAPRAETRLRQDTNGVWRLTEVTAVTHRAGLPWQRKWTVTGGAFPSQTVVRVEALYAPGPMKTAKPFVTAAFFARMTTSAADGVTAALETNRADKARGRTFRLAAANRTAAKNASWAQARLAFPFPGLDLGAAHTAFGVWVKGDGSGALLNLQFTSPGEFVGGVSDHHVRLDFTGWRHVTVLLRERDATAFSDYRWPYGGYAAIYRDRVAPEHVASFSVFLNDIAPGRSAAVELGEVQALEQRKQPFNDVALVVNGVTSPVPFRMSSGEYAEYAEGVWTRYSELGEELVRRTVTNAPAFLPGANTCALQAPDGMRAEVTVFTAGQVRDAFGKLTPAMKKTMSVEAFAPFEYRPKTGVTGPKLLPVRPDERATLSVEIQGPAVNPSFVFGAIATCTFSEDLAEDESLICRDGRAWTVVETKTGRLRRAGTLSVTLPELRRTVPFAFRADVPADKACIVEILKEYR